MFPDNSKVEPIIHLPAFNKEYIEVGRSIRVNSKGEKPFPAIVVDTNFQKLNVVYADENGIKEMGIDIFDVLKGDFEIR